MFSLSRMEKNIFEWTSCTTVFEFYYADTFTLACNAHESLYWKGSWASLGSYTAYVKDFLLLVTWGRKILLIILL